MITEKKLPGIKRLKLSGFTHSFTAFNTKLVNSNREAIDIHDLKYVFVFFYFLPKTKSIAL